MLPHPSRALCSPRPRVPWAQWFPPELLLFLTVVRLVHGRLCSYTYYLSLPLLLEGLCLATLPLTPLCSVLSPRSCMIFWFCPPHPFRTPSRFLAKALFVSLSPAPPVLQTHTRELLEDSPLRQSGAGSSPHTWVSHSALLASPEARAFV